MKLADKSDWLSEHWTGFWLLFCVLLSKVKLPRQASLPRQIVGLHFFPCLLSLDLTQTESLLKLAFENIHIWRQSIRKTEVCRGAWLCRETAGLINYSAVFWWKKPILKFEISLEQNQFRNGSLAFILELLAAKTPYTEWTHFVFWLPFSPFCTLSSVSQLGLLEFWDKPTRFTITLTQKSFPVCESNSKTHILWNFRWNGYQDKSMPITKYFKATLANMASMTHNPKFQQCIFQALVIKEKVVAQLCCDKLGIFSVKKHSCCFLSRLLWYNRWTSRH